MGLIEFLMLAAIAYLAWRISDQLPDLLFRISEIQRDVADIRKRLIDVADATPAAKPARKRAPAARKTSPAKKAPAAKKESAASKADPGTDESSS